MGGTKKEKEFYNRIDEIIWLEWDPIGVNDTEEARDEYYSYLPSLFKHLMEGSDVKKISKYLDHIETVNMGLTGNPKKNFQIAQKLINVKNELYPQ